MKPFLSSTALPGQSGDEFSSSRLVKRRVNSVLQNCGPAERALAIGCNIGPLSRALLRSRSVMEVDALEITGAGSRKLRPHSSSPVEIQFSGEYCASIYNAHHLIFAEHGYDAAMRFWLDLVGHTRHCIFLESGHLAEGSRWGWQRELRRYYHSDEDYFANLLIATRPRLRSVRMVDRFWVHGARRWLLLIELAPPRQVRETCRAQPRIRVDQVLRRTIGSGNQQLVGEERANRHEVHQGVVFRLGRAEDGRRVFCKEQIVPWRAEQELSVGRQIDDPRFVRALAITRDCGLVFPFVDLPRLTSMRRGAVSDRKAVGREISSLFAFAEEKRITLDLGHEREFRLIDLIDLHAGNIFYDPNGPALRVCDLEVHSLANRPRNRRHMATMLWRWGERDFQTVMTIVACRSSHRWNRLVRCFQSPTRRIAERTSSPLLSRYTRFRERLDSRLMSMFPGYRR